MEFREAKITDAHSSRKRAIVELSERTICEPCAPSNSADAGGTALVNANPMQKGSHVCVVCGKGSSYGPIGGATNSAFLCSEDGQKHGGCENVKKKKCEEYPCKLTPSFGPAGGLPKTATCCRDHGRLKGYVNIVDPLCEHANCVQFANFGPRGGKKARCGDHPKNGDFNLNLKKCEQPNCDDYAYYGPRGGKIARCVHHQKNGDFNLSRKKCEQPNCDDSAYYGPRGGKGARCYTHREEDDVNLYGKLCEGSNCDNYAIYGVEGGRRQYCVLHFDPDKHINVHHKRCVKCTLRPYKYPHPDSIVGQCIECDPAIFGPRMKQKEENAKAKLEEAFGETNPAMREESVHFCGEGADRTACGKNQSMRARCDFVLQSTDKVVVVEVDEDAHRHYCQKSDIARVNDIYTAYLSGGNLNNRHVHFVRFNPDKFKIGGQEANVSIEIRYATLIKVVRAALAPSSSEDNRPWSMRHLYYDCDANGRLCIMDEMNEHIHPLVDAPIYGDCCD